MAFTLAERQALGIHGLIPPRFKTQEEQVELCLTNLKRYSEDLNKYIYLMGLQVKLHCWMKKERKLIKILFSGSK